MALARVPPLARELSDSSGRRWGHAAANDCNECATAALIAAAWHYGCSPPFRALCRRARGRHTVRLRIVFNAVCNLFTTGERAAGVDCARIRRRRRHRRSLRERDRRRGGRLLARSGRHSLRDALAADRAAPPPLAEKLSAKPSYSN